MIRKREGIPVWLKSRKRAIIISLIALGSVMGLSYFLNLTSLFDFRSPLPEPRVQNSETGEIHDEAETELPVPGSLRPLTVLLVGVDIRPGEPSISNTDTLVVAQVNPQTGQIGLLSIPRDTQVELPMYGTGKINMAARVGSGLESTKKMAENLLGLKLDGYLLTDFAGFKKTIDTLGGITLTVEKDMYYITGDAEDGIINLKQGTQRLNGDQALQYARFRQDALADISRTVRQQAVLKAAAQELLQLKTLPKLPVLIPQIVSSIKTDLDFKEMLALANVMVRFNKATVISQTLPGNFVTEEGISYWKVNTQETKEVARNFFESGKTVNVFSHKVESQIVQGMPSEKAEAVQTDKIASKEKEPQKANIKQEKMKPGKTESKKAGSEETGFEKAELVNKKLDSGNSKLQQVEDGIIVEVEVLTPLKPGRDN